MKTIKINASSLVHLFILLVFGTMTMSCTKAAEVKPDERATSIDEDPVEIEDTAKDTGPGTVDTGPGTVDTEPEDDTEPPTEIEASFLSEVWANSGEDRSLPTSCGPPQMPPRSSTASGTANG